MPLYSSAGAQQAGRWLSGGEHTVTAAEATATEATIDTGLTTIDTFMVEVYRANVQVTGDAVITAAGGKLTVDTGATTPTYVVTAGDVIRWLAWGRQRLN